MQKRDPQKELGSTLKRLSGVLFPALSELQLFVVIAVMVVFGVSTSWGEDGIPSILIVLALLFVGIHIVLRAEFNVYVKSYVSLLYYGFFMVVALNVLNSQKMPDNPVSVESLNFWLVNFVLVIAVIRGLLALALARANDRLSHVMLAESYSSAQYQPTAFAVAGSAAFATVLIIHSYVSDPAMCMILSVTYSSIFVSLVGLIVPNRFWKY